MPSGSHSSGGGGSHFGGGSSGGSHFGGFSRSSRGNSTNLGPRVVVFGGRRYIVSGQRRTGLYALMFAIVVLVFALFSGCLITNGAKQSIQTIKDDYARYQQMITYAETNTEYQIKAVITDSFKHESGKYYITYAFPLNTVVETNLWSNYLEDLADNTVENNWVLGYSYSVYSLEQVSTSGLMKGDIINLAINNKNTEVNKDTDSIPFDYKDMPLTQDGEYLEAKHSKKIGPIVITVAVVLIAGCVVGMVFVVKTSKLEEEAKAEQTATAQTNAPTSQPKQRLCAYCGAAIESDAKKCPNCGGSQNV